MVSGQKQIRTMIGYAIIVFAVLLSLSWYFRPTTDGVPDVLIGSYHTDNADYADRALESDSVSIKCRHVGH